MIFNNPGNTANLRAVKASTSLHSHRVQPELAHPVLALYVYVRWFRTVAGIEKETVRTLPQNGGHS